MMVIQLSRLRSLLFIMILTVICMTVPASAKMIDRVLINMTLEEKIGQMLMPALPSTVHDSTTLTPAIIDELANYHVGGVILFSPNLTTPTATTALIANLQRHLGAKTPLFVGVDQEGGRVNRLEYGVKLPGNMALAATANLDNASLAAQIMAAELKALGFNLNFAPVLDINSNPLNPVIGSRAFGDDAQAVAAWGGEFIKGLQSMGVAAVGKHFPGHGDTAVDSHLALPSLNHNLNQLTSRELVPFKTVLQHRPAMIMTAHIALPAIESGQYRSHKTGSLVNLPATLSPTILTGLLRQQLGYDGIIITDALNMKAIKDHFGTEAAAVRAVQAGADILLMPELAPTHRALVRAVQEGQITIERIDQSVRRILAAKRKYTATMSAPIAINEKQRTANALSLAAQSVTLLTDQNQQLPLKPVTGQTIMLLAPNEHILSIMRRELEQILRDANLNCTLRGYNYQHGVTNNQLIALKQAEHVIMATSNLNTRNQTVQTRAAQTLANTAVAAGKPLAVLAVSTPYDIVKLPQTASVICVYAPIEPNISAGINVIMGKQSAPGRLPVTIGERLSAPAK